MHILTESESLQVNGGYQYNIEDAALMSSAFSWFFGVAGAAASAAWYTNLTHQLPTDAITVLLAGYPRVTLTIALYAGFGAGVVVGSLVGLGIYYSGLLTPSE